MSTTEMPSMPLAMARPGQTLTVRRVRGTDDERRHLREVGFVDGAEVQIVSAAKSNIIVRVKGACFGLDMKTARHIMAA